MNETSAATTMKRRSIREWRDLTVAQREAVALIDWTDGDPPASAERAHRLGLHGPERGPHPAYRDFYATEDGEVLGRVAALPLTFSSANGPFPAWGIADVVTRPDRLHEGRASRLLREVHRRAARAGADWAFLWTRQSWGAHRAYERLGYVDLYSPPAALRRIPSSRPLRLPSGYASRSALSSDASAIERCLARSVAGRLGFVERPRGRLVRRFRGGRIRPEQIALLLRDGELRGYALIALEKDDAGCLEAVYRTPSDAVPLLDLIEGSSAGRLLALGRTTFVRDQATELGRRGYHRIARSHSTLMGRPLHRGAPSLATVRDAIESPRFSCHLGDMF